MLFFVIINFVLPLVLLIGGLCMKKEKNGKINGIVGYRTSRSMKNQDTWKFSHEACSRLWISYGVVLTLLCIPIDIISYLSGNQVAVIITLIYMLISLILIFVSIYQVESLLKKNYDENGLRKC